MKQIFLFFALLANLALIITFALGWRIEDAASIEEAARQQFSMHFLFALASTAFVLLVHAIVLTYFMGTGRWIEETTQAYKFDDAARKQNIQLKYKFIPGMVFCMCIIIVTGAFGAIADPASNAQLAGSATIHFSLGMLTVVANILVSLIEYQQISRNTDLVDAVYAEVLAVRKERGLP